MAKPPPSSQGPTESPDQLLDKARIAARLLLEDLILHQAELSGGPAAVDHVSLAEGRAALDRVVDAITKTITVLDRHDH